MNTMDNKYSNRTYNRNKHRQQRQNSYQSSFNRRPVITKPEFKYNDTDFPDIVPQTEHKIGENCCINFIDAIKTECVEDELVSKDEPKMPGWVQIKPDNGQLKFIDNTRERTPYKLSFNQLVEKWEHYAYMYDETYGEGEYERVYLPYEEYEEEDDDEESDDGEWSEV